MDDQIIDDGVLLPDEHLKAWRVAKVNGSEAGTHSNISDEKRRLVTGEQRLEPFKRARIAVGSLK
jgi:hypothetical protein